MTVAEAIKMILKRSGLNLREAAEKLGISHVHLCNVKNGKAMYSIELLEKITEVFDCNPYLLAAVHNGEVASVFYERYLKKEK